MAGHWFTSSFARAGRRTSRLIGVLAVAALLLGLPGSATARVADTEPPTTPGPIEVVEETLGSITLTWAASTDNVGVAGYQVHVLYTDYIEIVPAPTNHIVLDVRPSATYSFLVHAVDAAGNESPGTDWLTVTVHPGDDEAPTRPGGVGASEVTDTSLLVSWEPSTDNVYVALYEVVALGAAPEVVAAAPQHPPTDASARVRGLTPGTEYTFAVRARDDAGNVSELSEPLVVRTLDPVPVPTGCVVEYDVVSEWRHGFHAEVTIRNHSMDARDGWTLRWDFPDGQTIASLWGGVHAGEGASVAVGAAGWNSALPPGGAVRFGFIGRSQRDNGVPDRFTLDSASGATSGCDIAD